MANAKPTLEMWLKKSGTGRGVTAVAGVTWPGGHYSEWQETVEPREYRYEHRQHASGIRGGDIGFHQGDFEGDIGFHQGDFEGDIGFHQGDFEGDIGFSLKKMFKGATHAIGSAAKGKLLKAIGKILKSPVTDGALAAFGVPPGSAKRAGAAFESMRHAAASLANKKAGNLGQARAHALAAAAIAETAEMSAADAEHGGKQLYYLTIE